MKANDFVKKFGLDEARKQIKKPTGIYGAAFDYQFMGDLKRLFESHELVESYGGINGARKELANLCDSLIDCAYLCQAIADVESCHVD